MAIFNSYVKLPEGILLAVSKPTVPTGNLIPLLLYMNIIFFDGYIRRPRPTQGGARQGREVVNTKTIHNNNNNSNSNSKKKKQPKSSFSMGFRSYVRHFRGAILGLLRPSPQWCFPIRGPAAARRKSSQNHNFLWVSEVTLGIFGVQFWGFSVLHCHGVFPSGDQQQQQQKRLQQQEEKPAKIHSSSKKKKQPNHHFLWVSEVTLGIFGVQFWGFCHGVFPSGD